VVDIAWLTPGEEPAYDRLALPETPIAFDGVTMLATGGLGHTFRIGEKEVFVGSAVPMPGTAAFVVGQVGRLVLPRWFVEKNELQGGQVHR
jgi:hypothetical protein